MNNKNEMTLKETERIYHFPKGERVVLKEVRKIVIEPSGTHKIKTADGKRHIIKPDWLSIEIDGEENWE